MDAKQAVAAAKQHLTEVFAGEFADEPSLEEVWFDDETQDWCVTFGLKRSRVSVGLGPLVMPFDYKVVRLPDDGGAGRAISIKDRYRDR